MTGGRSPPARDGPGGRRLGRAITHTQPALQQWLPTWPSSGLRQGTRDLARRGRHMDCPPQASVEGHPPTLEAPCGTVCAINRNPDLNPSPAPSRLWSAGSSPCSRRCMLRRTVRISRTCWRPQSFIPKGSMPGSRTCCGASRSPMCSSAPRGSWRRRTRRRSTPGSKPCVCTAPMRSGPVRLSHRARGTPRRSTRSRSRPGASGAPRWGKRPSRRCRGPRVPLMPSFRSGSAGSSTAS